MRSTCCASIPHLRKSKLCVHRCRKREPERSAFMPARSLALTQCMLPLDELEACRDTTKCLRVHFPFGLRYAIHPAATVEVGRSQASRARCFPIGLALALDDSTGVSGACRLTTCMIAGDECCPLRCRAMSLLAYTWPRNQRAFTLCTMRIFRPSTS